MSVVHLQDLMENASGTSIERRKEVAKAIRRVSTQPYVTHKEFSAILAEFEVSKEEWIHMVRSIEG